MRIFDIVDPTSANESFEALDQDVIQIGAGHFRARRIAIRLSSCEVIVHQAWSRLRSRTTINESLLAFTALGPRAHATLNGFDLGPDVLIAAGPGAAGDLVGETGYRSATRASTTVSEVALDWSSWHFSDFSKAYKTCFSESPSQTLRRPAS